jgi:hypothetical protein
VHSVYSPLRLVTRKKKNTYKIELEDQSYNVSVENSYCNRKYFFPFLKNLANMFKEQLIAVHKIVQNLCGLTRRSWKRGGSVVEWFSTLVVCTKGPWFKSRRRYWRKRKKGTNHLSPFFELYPISLVHLPVCGLEFHGLSRTFNGMITHRRAL